MVLFAGRQIVKRIAYRAGIWRAHYPYYLAPAHLVALINAIEDTADIEGCVVEVGIARGMTTRFLAEHLLGSGTKLYAIDTFSSFDPADMAHEVSERGKSLGRMKVFWNDLAGFRRDMAGLDFVIPVQGDIKTVNLPSPIRVALLDVDLYRPTLAGLSRLYERLVPGGYIFVDDVEDGQAWDGAFQAFHEFCKARGIAPEVVRGSLGVVRKLE